MANSESPQDFRLAIRKLSSLAELFADAARRFPNFTIDDHGVFCANERDAVAEFTRLSAEVLSVVNAAGISLEVGRIPDGNLDGTGVAAVEVIEEFAFDSPSSVSSDNLRENEKDLAVAWFSHLLGHPPKPGYRVSSMTADIRDHVAMGKRFVFRESVLKLQLLIATLEATCDERQTGVAVQSSIQTVGQNEDRDRWIYDECRKGTPHKEISHRMKTEHGDWQQLESVQGIRDAALRFAERHGLPLPPRRQRSQ